MQSPLDISKEEGGEWVIWGGEVGGADFSTPIWRRKAEKQIMNIT